MPDEKWDGKTVAVTGGAGFIGSHFVEELLGRGATVLCLHRRDRHGVLAQLPHTGRLRPITVDVTDEAALGAVFRSGGIDAVFHCAATTGTFEVRRNQAAHILEANMRAVTAILDLARRHDVPDVVLLSSSDIYLAPATDPISENDDYRTSMHYSPDGYYLAKLYTEMLAEAHRQEYGSNVFLPRATSVYGPRDNFGSDIPRVVPQMLDQVHSGGEIEVWGDGSQTRTYMYVTDMVRAVLTMVEKNKHHVLNIGTSETVSVLDLARLVCAVLGKPERIRCDLSRPSGRRSRTLDLTRMHEIIDTPPRPLREGIRQTAEWYLRHRAGAMAVT
ncbi:NAD-dependent epimerase/dehydratase family protein [Saccharothrix sp. NRRL B-16314]|uniref:NAD-dependent epimerase/dehydratase family protein n=1 Tax=Saccharothrix sp. NRRL B-16314 TaxID=1463825 RepID=UPI0005269B25|nr:SDR family NAD(P)-dependent oxidoreductase [Saccharothrix sp. NRRL B-16314]